MQKTSKHYIKYYDSGEVAKIRGLEAIWKRSPLALSFTVQNI